MGDIKLNWLELWRSFIADGKEGPTNLKELYKKISGKVMKALNEANTRIKNLEVKLKENSGRKIPSNENNKPSNKKNILSNENNKPSNELSRE